MKSLYKESLIALLAIGVVLPVSAQDGLQAGHVTPAAASPSTAPATLTGKERLGRKWMDEQRIDNCHVPIDKRGTRPRPDACPHVPAGRPSGGINEALFVPQTAAVQGSS